jgi:hypothetical protein
VSSRDGRLTGVFPVSPGGGLVVEGAGLQASVQDADEAVREPSECVVVLICPGFPSPYGAPASASRASCSRHGIPPPSRLACRHRAPDLTGFPRSACASSDRGGRPPDPEASGVHTTGEDSPAAACRSSTARPCTPVFIPSAGALGNEASAGVHSRSPVRSSPRLRSRMERERSGFFPELRTPQLPAAHVRAGTGLEH